MGSDKNHLYSKEDYQKDQQENAKRRTQQGFSRFSIAAATSLNDAGNTQAPPAMQIDTRDSWFRVINDTFGSVGLQTVDVFFGTIATGGRSAVTYNIYTVNDDITFAFSGTPYGKMLPFTLDLTIDKPGDPRPIISWPASLLNPPTLPSLTDNLRLILHFETVRDAVSERQVFIGGSVVSGAGGGTFTDRIPAVIEVPQGQIAYPDILSFSSGGSIFKISGFVMPNTSTPTINCKVESVRNQASPLNPKIRVAWINLGTGSTQSVVIRIRRLILGPGSQIPMSGALTDETDQQVVVADLQNTKGGTLISLTANPAFDDTVFFQVVRRTTDPNDDYPGDIFIYSVHMEMDRVTV